MPEHPIIDEHFRGYALALLRHHYLLADGKEEGLQVEVVEDRMSELWGKLNDTQRQHLRGISSDLNWIRRGYIPPPKGRKKEDVTPEELREFYRLNEARDYVPLLHALRICSAAVPRAFVAFCRATCYVNLGLREVSEPFLASTIDLAGNESMLGRTAFNMLIHVSPAGAFKTALNVMSSPQKYPPVVVALAMQFFVEFLGGEAPSGWRDELAEKVRSASGRLDDEPTPHEERVLFWTAAVAQLMSFGFVDEAVKCLEQALKLDPENAEVVGWLGEALYGRARSEAVKLFKRSIASGTRLVRPYLHLANHYLAERDFDSAKAYAAHAADKARDDLSLGIALEIMAISLSEQGADPNIALGLLRRAAKLAPSYKRIAHNLAALEAFMKSNASPAAWETEEATTPFEARERWRGEVKGLVTV